MPEAPRIFAYLDYRSYLEDFFAFRKSRDADFSLRAFARLPGLALSSSSFISAVIKGRKNLSQGLRLRFGRAMGLGPAEMEYFELLIQCNQSKTADDRDHYRAQLARFHGPRARVLHDGQARFYARWYYAVVWHYFGLRQDHNSPARIAKSIFPPITPQQAEEAIRVLLELKLIRKLANGYAVVDRHLAAGKGLRGSAARDHCKEFLRLALDGIGAAPARDRRFDVTSFSISERGRERVMERIDALRAEVRELAETDEGGAGAGRVYALSLQLFPCTLEEERASATAPASAPAISAAAGASAMPIESAPERHGARTGAGTSSNSGIARD